MDNEPISLDMLIQDLFDAIFVFLAGLFQWISDLFGNLIGGMPIA